LALQLVEHGRLKRLPWSEAERRDPAEEGVALPRRRVLVEQGLHRGEVLGPGRAAVR
jgi:hypothetical protein